MNPEEEALYILEDGTETTRAPVHRGRSTTLATRHIAADRPATTSIDLPMVEIEGERRGYDTPEDVVDSRVRKGNAATASDAGPGARRRELMEAIDETLGLSRVPERLREVPIIGGALGDWAESGTASGTGAVQGATMGFADELGGAVAAGNALLEGGDPGGAYESTRDRMRGVAASDREDSPMAYGAGEVAGALMTAPLTPTATAGRGAGLASRLGTRAAEGAAYGALAGAGSSEETGADLAVDAAEGAVGGGLAGGVFGAAGELGSAGMDAARRAASRADELRVASVVGSGNSPLSVRAQRDVAALPGGTAGAAERIRRMGIGSRFGTIEDAARETSRAVDDADAALGSFYEELDAALPDGVPVDRFTGAFEGVADDLARNPETRRLAPRHRSRASDWTASASELTPPGEAPRMSSRGVREALGTMREGVDFIGASEGRTAAGAELDAYRAGRRALDDVAGEVLPPARAAEFRPMRDDAATARTLDRYARQAAMRADRAGPSLTGSLAANAAASMGGSLPATLATGAGVGALRARLPAMRATGAEAVRALLESRGARALGEYGPPLMDALSRGGEVFAGRHAALMRSDPEYATAVESAMEEPHDRPMTARELFEAGLETEEEPAPRRTARELFEAGLE